MNYRILKIAFFLVLSLIEISYAQKFFTQKEYLQLVEKQSPDLMAERAAVDESLARSAGIRLPPPMLGFMNMRESGEQNNGIEFSQEIPLPSKINKDLQMREIEKKTQEKVFNYKSKQILTLAKNAYLDFWMAFEKHRLLLEKKHWYLGHLKISRVVAKSDNASQAHFLEIETGADLIENDLLSAENELFQKKLGLKVYAPLLVLENLVPFTPDSTLEEIKSLELILKDKRNAEISIKEAEVDFMETSRDLKKQSYFPDLFVRYRAYEGNQMTPKNEEFMVGVTLPFFYFWQPKAEIKELEAKVARARAELNKVSIESTNLIAGNLKKIEVLQEQLKRLKEKMIPRAQKRAKIVEIQPARSMEILDSQRMVWLDLLQMREKEIEIKVELEKLISETQKLGDSN